MFETSTKLSKIWFKMTKFIYFWSWRTRL